nr:hypothetical protein [Tanacetum cinerariifolium]
PGNVNHVAVVAVRGVIHGIDAGAALGGRVHHEAGGLPHVVFGSRKYKVGYVAGVEVPGLVAAPGRDVAPPQVGAVDDGDEAVFGTGFVQAA